MNSLPLPGFLRQLCGIYSAALVGLPIATTPANAHVSEQGFVLLLPTEVYSAAGIVVVLVTIFLLALVPAAVLKTVFQPVALHRPLTAAHWPMLTRAASLLMLMVLVGAGWLGSRDPLINPLPLMIWTVWWIGLLAIQGLVGDIWRWINPWLIIATVVDRITGARPPLTLPEQAGCWPAVVVFALFSSFALADPAPDDPARLAAIISAYMVFTAIGMAAFGSRAWLAQAEWTSVVFSLFARSAPWCRIDGNVGFGLPGWRLAARPNTDISVAVLAVILLATGSFDGLNETFWWLALIGINPLEFPGRSAVSLATTAGLISANLILIVIFATCVWMGNRLSKFARPDLPSPTFSAAFSALALSLIPIALGYHVAHFLTAFLVNGQYALVALSDPLGSGVDLLGLGQFYVSTGFFNSLDSVRTIWLVQATAVVIGHVLSILVAHRLAIRLYGSHIGAFTSQLPLALFMVGYTALGLWLLATPRGA